MMAFKRMACLALLFILLSAAITASAYAPYEKLHVTNCDAWVSLREAPTADSRRVMQLPLGALVSFVDENGDFLKVSYSGTMGYVGREYLRATSDDDRVPMYVANCSEWISLREGETKDSVRLAKIPLGTRVLSCGRAEDPDAMARVVYDHYSGYVLPEYLSLLPPKQDECALSSAVLHVPDKNGNDFVQTVADEERLKAMEAMLRSVTPGFSGQCPYQAQLVLTLRDGSVLRLMYPTDECTAFFTTDGSVYTFPEAASAQFWTIFDEAAQAAL